ncbi:aldose epimerase family protein [Lapidilactobacillus gannanensis]|jgi:galactose mutarotase-like enzyme|uniref:Aldose 1-epimerase n=1 Tax=Lapidilactobacillus gannanensis TaxID=2486002 RepID=A0ABW4BJV5_9LACO|nr:hypothetical protein [Lapidilactobacillus gannanensis]MCH4056692.1 hypothetical protein [Lactobacillaceae bacterium]
MITLKNSTVTATITEQGAQLKKLTALKNQLDYVATQSDSILFPAIGKSYQDTYEYQDRHYQMPIHGFAKDAIWQIFSQSSDQVTLKLTDNEISRANYPFYFQFLVTYRLLADGIDVQYHLTNMGNVTMAFSLGALIESALPWRTDINLTDYQLDLAPEKALTLTREVDPDYFRTGAILPSRYFHRGSMSLATPEIDQKLFILTNRDMQSLCLNNQQTGQSLCLKTADFPFFSVQYDANNQLIQLGLWNGLPDKQGISSELLRKEGNLTLPARDQLVLGYQVIID